MLILIGMLIFFALSAFWTWAYGNYLIEKGYLADWKMIRNDFLLLLILISAGMGSALGTLKFIGWLGMGIALLLGV